MNINKYDVDIIQLKIYLPVLSVGTINVMVIQFLNDLMFIFDISGLQFLVTYRLTHTSIYI